MINRRAGGMANLLFVTVILITAICSAAEQSPTRKAPDANVPIIKPIPQPVVEFKGKEIILPPKSGTFARYNLAVTNYQAYPAALFAPAPNLPPCGSNKNSSRTWVEIEYRDLKTQQPHRIYGFCALGSPQDLLHLWFAVPEGQHPPSPVYVVLNDRAANRKYVSNPVAIPAPASQTKPGGNP